MSTSSELELLPVNAEEEQENLTAAQGWLVRAQQFEVADPDTYLMACQYVRDMRDNLAAVKKWWLPMVDSANKAHKALTTRRAEVTKPYDQAVALLEQKVTAYRVEEKRKADKQAVAERRRLEEVERERREAEALAAADADDEVGFRRADGAQGAPVPLPPEVAPAAILAVAAPKVDNLRERTIWKARLRADLSDEEALRMLCSFISDGGPVAFAEPVWAALDAFAAGCAGAMNVPGVEFYEETKVTIPKSRGG